MTKTDKDAREIRRVELLRQYGILDSPAEEAFDEIARLASRICNAPMALVAFIDADRQWNKSTVGWSHRQIPRADSICAHALDHPGVLVIPDTSEDGRVKENRFVTGPPRVRFYAGTALRIVSEGNGSAVEAIGTLCVMDTSPRMLAEAEEAALGILARQVVAHLQLRRGIAELHARQAQTEEALQHSESFYHSLVETIPQNIFRKNLRGEFTFANSRFCATLNRSRDHILGKTDSDFFPAELASKYQADDRKVIESNCPLTTSEWHQTSDGNMLYVKVIKAPLHDLDGQISGIQGVFWDETDRYKAEEALEYERALFRAMLDYVPDSIYFKDRESRFLAISRSLATRLGLKGPADAVGKSDGDFFALEHAREAFEDEQRILRTDQPIVAKTEKEISRHGDESWVLTTKVPLKDSRGQTMGTFGISKDITDLKAAEVEIAKARDVALESARLKSEFLANMSHEIRTPLNAVIGISGLLLDTPLSEEQRDFARTIRSSADTLLNIISDILDFSKIEAGKLAIEVIDFDLAEVVEGTAELLAESAQARNIELATWIDERIPRHLRGDPRRVRQVLTNLLGNALKFTENGEAVVRVTRERETERSVILRLEVRDTGIGIAPEAQSRIFQAFTQADGSTTRKYGGTGLGLSISKQLIELMHGQLGFESAPGRGSVFWFMLSFEKQSEQRHIPAMASALEGRRVMIVDDNRTNREIIDRQILSWKMRNGAAESGVQALELLKEAAAKADPYQLVIVDMEMPGMDGLALAKAIKADPGLAEARLILLVSVGHLPQEKLWREGGISACLMKPVKESRLFDAIVSVTRGISEVPAPPGKGMAEKSEDMDGLKKTVRILVAEDNVVNQKVALRQLQKLGYSADAVANGYEVLQALETVPYDIILMDCQMPELDGYEAARRIRSEENRSRLQGESRDQYIVAMTANALTGDREECLAAGMNDYISKPVRIDELRTVLERGVEYVQGRRTNLREPAFASPVLDETILQGLRELRVPGEPDPLRELIDLFVADTPERIQRIESAVSANNSRQLESAAHSLKGSASNLGAARLAEYCGELLRQVREGEITETSAGEKLRAEFEEARNALLRL